jgi:hypothetical protein
MFLLALPMVFVGCTLNFTNVDTHGTTSDLVDEVQTTDISPNVELPLLPK